MVSSSPLFQPNTILETCFNKSRNPSYSALQQTAYWMGHKVFTVVLLPINLLGIAGGLGGMALSTCTLGAFKVMVFAISLGNVKLEFNTGFLHTAFFAADATMYTFSNLSQLLSDVKRLIEGIFHLLLWMGRQLHITDSMEAIVSACRRICSFLLLRCKIGFEKAGQHDLPLPEQITSWIFNLETHTAKYRQFWQDRPVRTIVQHTLASCLNIPINTIVLLSFTACTLCCGGFLLANGVFASVTDRTIPIPTTAQGCASVSWYATAGLIQDIFQNFSDATLLTYKVMKMVGILKVATSIRTLFAYFPEAIGLT